MTRYQLPCPGTTTANNGTFSLDSFTARHFLFCLICFSPSLAGQGLSPGECHRVRLEKAVLWTTSGVWADEHRAAIVIVDVFRQELMQFSSNGIIERRLSKLASVVGASPKSLQHPTNIRNTEEGYLLEDEGPDEIFNLNRRFESKSSLGIKRKIQGDVRLAAIYDWSPLSRGILAFGDLQIYGDNWVSAFLYFDELGKWQVFHYIEINDDLRNQYIRNMPYIATTEDAGYILLLEERPSIVEVRPHVDDFLILPHFPEDFRQRPRLPRQGPMGPREATEHYKILEMATMPAALYSLEEELYLLAKEAAERDGSTEWWLIRLDPRDGAEISRFKLPTAAPNLTVVPGRRRWAVIEKGSVESVGRFDAPYMDTSSMVIFPTYWLEPEAAPGPYGRSPECTAR